MIPFIDRVLYIVEHKRPRHINSGGIASAVGLQKRGEMLLRFCKWLDELVLCRENGPKSLDMMGEVSGNEGWLFIGQVIIM